MHKQLFFPPIYLSHSHPDADTLFFPNTQTPKDKLHINVYGACRFESGTTTLTQVSRCADKLRSLLKQASVRAQSYVSDRADSLQKYMYIRKGPEDKEALKMALS